MTHYRQGSHDTKSAYRVKWVIGALAVALTANCVGMEGVSAAQEHKTSSSQTSSSAIMHLSKIEGILQADVDAGVRAGYQVAVSNRNGIVYSVNVGAANIEENIPISSETRFRIASLTKAITTVAVLQLVEDGVVSLNDPVSDYIPEFAEMKVATDELSNDEGGFETTELVRPITIHHLLTHTEGLAYAFIPSSDLAMTHAMANPYRQSGVLADRVDKLATLPLFDQPGEKYRYGYGLDIAGRVIEIASGVSLEAYFNERIFTPLGMTSTEFFIDETDFEGLAVVYSNTADGALLKTEADPYKLAPNAQGQGWMSGGGGLISTGADYSRFLSMLLNDGALNGRRILSPASVDLMMQRAVADRVLNPEQHPTLDLPRSPGVTLGLGGYVVENAALSGIYHADGQWGWEGYYDTSAFLNKSEDLAVVILTQSSPWERLPSKVKYRVSAIAYGAALQDLTPEYSPQSERTERDYSADAD